MQLLKTIEFGDAFVIDEGIAQEIDENPNRIYEQLIFHTDLPLSDCLADLESTLTAALGCAPEPYSVTANDAAKVVNFSIQTPYQQATVQVVCEHTVQGCQGFVRFITGWIMAAI